ncbi:ATP-binding protein [Desertivirga arenae]|uniref:ATP-binding protein n=1 Tax=Desertivirga arenae TaxID=2810309 RepID=UPI001A972DBC|nr:AAA family ATPase [Pedobacter sp. SYSU D00823]
MQSLYSKYRRVLGSVSTAFKRSLSESINWSSRAICIEGARGTGKSTLMLQYIKESLPADKTLYVSLDDLYFKQHPLTEVAETFYNEGGRHLFLDEVHKYEDWQSAIKNIYDFFPELQLVISGSSILELQKSQADLSRRLVRYYLPELSLREYIALRYSTKTEKISLGDLLSNSGNLADHLIQTVPSPLKYFKEYLSYGSYPFIMEGEGEYLAKINQLINVIIDYDLPEAKAIEVSTQAKLKRLLYIISTCVPYKPNISKLAEQIGTSRVRLLEMLYILEQAQLINSLRSSVHGISLMNKPEKIFLENNSLITALAEGVPDTGNQRETFFLSQLRNSGAQVTYPDLGDFKVNDQYLFEVGGKNKTSKQVKNIPNSFLALDDIEYGYGNTIPLWMFGFLY